MEDGEAQFCGTYQFSTHFSTSGKIIVPMCNTKPFGTNAHASTQNTLETFRKRLREVHDGASKTFGTAMLMSEVWNFGIDLTQLY